MAVSVIAATAANGDTVSMPTHQPGDRLVICVYNNNGTASFTPPAGWALRTTTSGSSNVIGVYHKIATSSNESSGTWTNATQIIAITLRSDQNKYVIPAGLGAASGTVSPITSAALPAANHLGGSAGGTSMGIYFIGARGNATDLETPQSGLTNVIAIAGASAGELVCHRLTTPSATLTALNQTVSGTLTAWRSVGFEAYESTISINTSKNVGYYG